MTGRFLRWRGCGVVCVCVYVYVCMCAVLLLLSVCGGEFMRIMPVEGVEGTTKLAQVAIG